MSTELFNVADIFGENVFNDTVMQERLPKKVYKNLRKTIEEGKDLDLETADVIAHDGQLKKERLTIHIGSCHLQELQQRSMIPLSQLRFQVEKF